MNRPVENICPITLEVMRDPVVAADGNSYERDAIHKFFQTSRRSSLTNKNLNNTTLIPNYALGKLIADWSHVLKIGYCYSKKKERNSTPTTGKVGRSPIDMKLDEGGVALEECLEKSNSRMLLMNSTLQHIAKQGK